MTSPAPSGESSTASDATPAPAAASATPEPTAQRAPAESKPSIPAETQALIDAAAAAARRDGEQAGRKAAADEAKRKAAEEKAKESGEFQQLAEARGAEIAELKAQLAARDRALLVAKVAAKHRLPEALADRLAGDDEAALEADATALAKLLAPRPAPDTEAGAGTVTPFSRDRPGAKRADGPVYAFDGSRKVPWPARVPERP